MTSPLPATAAPSSGSTPRRFFILLACYFLFQLLLRLWLSPALEQDEAEQVLWTQQLELGYGTQPPLYTWLQWLVFQLFGTSLLALALFKNLLLFGTYAFSYLSARVFVGVRGATLAAFSMLLLPQIGWESQRDLTHSVLLTTLASATLLLTLRLALRQRPLDYLLLGLVIGMGMLSKYSYALFVVILCATTLWQPTTRRIWRNPWLLASIGVAVLVMLPHGWWLLHHLQEATQGTLDKLESDASGSGEAASKLHGLGQLAKAVAGFLGLWAVVMLAVFRQALWRPAADPWTTPTQSVQANPSDTPAPGQSWGAAFWRRYALVLALVLLALVLIGDVTHMKDRWLQPFLFCAPIGLLAWRPELAQGRSARVLGVVLVVVAVVLSALLALRPAFKMWRDKPDQLNEPLAALVTQLQQAGYDGHQTIVTDDMTLGGNLLTQFPAARVVLLPQQSMPQQPFWLISNDAGFATAVDAATAGQSVADGPTPATGQLLALPYLFSRTGQAPARYRYAQFNTGSAAATDLRH